MAYEDPFEKVENPFAKRASERILNPDVFLRLFSPEPVNFHFKSLLVDDDLFERLIVIVGTPGSGKTTIGRLFELSCLTRLSRSSDQALNELKKVLHELRALQDLGPTIAGTRIQMDQRFRDIWELNEFDEKTRHSLLESYIESKAVLGWIREINASGIDPKKVTIVLSDATTAESKFIGVESIDALKTKAQQIEEALFDLVNDLTPSSKLEAVNHLIGTYRPLGNLKGFHIAQSEFFSERTLRPLVIIDDAHDLHQPQFDHLKQFLVNRSFSCGRWILTRMDAIGPGRILSQEIDYGESTLATMHGPIMDRDVKYVHLQATGKQIIRSRKSFRKTAKSIAAKYLQRIPSIANTMNNEADLEALLSLTQETKEKAKKGVLDALEKDLERLVRQKAFEKEIVEQVQQEVERFLFQRQENDQAVVQYEEALKIAMMLIILNRMARKTPQRDLFFQDEGAAPLEVNAQSDIYNAARFHLSHQHNLAFYFEFEDVCDCASQNIEQFLMFSRELVYFLSDQIGKGKPPSIRAPKQHELIFNCAQNAFELMNFPYSVEVKRLVDRLGERCALVSLDPGAWIGSGCSAYGIEQGEFDKFVKRKKNEKAVKVLKYAVAYNMLTLRHNYKCQGKEWCLLELSGIALVRHKLTLLKGGFDKGTAKELAELMEKEN